MPVPFHFAYHVTDLDEARAFYTGALGPLKAALPTPGSISTFSAIS